VSEKGAELITLKTHKLEDHRYTEIRVINDEAKSCQSYRAER
jgi:hypothetical protein